MKIRHGIPIPDGPDAVQAVIDFWREMDGEGATIMNFREALSAYYIVLVEDFQDEPTVHTFETVNILERLQQL